ncbi:transcriptional repressor [Moraxella sp. Tifton1]|uniref:Fur family transcriptional regulator n=1 Tax=Moraxella oculi TaxID=2940516 RepID=UPI0020118E0A|nr:Fur family transcriptional regulator [Moraxella sp. Tifton1]MCL1623284.1 transcriptional repressor [Moraxella sp. Tifton1]
MTTSSHTCTCDHHHDVHHQDVNERIIEAKAHCKAQGVRFTPLREEVYALILASDRPMGAYDLISALQASRQKNGVASKNIAPPTIYRSLDFLLSEGLIHQLSSLNAYVPCCHPRSKHAAAFLICQSCSKVEECSNLPVNDIINFAKNDARFAVLQTIIELKGTCRDCQQ